MKKIVIVVLKAIHQRTQKCWPQLNVIFKAIKKEIIQMYVKLQTDGTAL